MLSIRRKDRLMFSKAYNNKPRGSSQAGSPKSGKWPTHGLRCAASECGKEGGEERKSAELLVTRAHWTGGSFSLPLIFHKVVLFVLRSTEGEIVALIFTEQGFACALMCTASAPVGSISHPAVAPDLRGAT